VPKQLNGSVLKAFSILDLFSPSRGEVTAAIVARELGLNGVTAHRFLRTLEEAGALVAAAKGVYRLGYRLVDLADRVGGHGTIGARLQPILDGITRDMNEASMATAFEADMVVCIARALSGQSLAVDVRVGTRLEAHCTAHGKLWLSSLGEAELDHYLDVVPRARMNRATITDRKRLLAEVARARQQGHATNDGEREEGIRAIAVPLRTRSGRMVAGLSVFGPSVRMTDEVMARALRRLRAAVVEAEQAMYGGQGDLGPAAAAAAGGRRRRPTRA
jgi:IclR family pca regulon transcriptional regulator